MTLAVLLLVQLPKTKSNMLFIAKINAITKCLWTSTTKTTLPVIKKPISDG